MQPLQPLSITLIFSLTFAGLPPATAQFALSNTVRVPNTAQTPTATQPSQFKKLYAYKPPAPPRRVGSPGRRSDGGARTGCTGNSGKPLVALVPVYGPQTSELVFGVTTVEYPTFWFYLPYQATTTGTFLLRDENNKTAYETQLALPQTPGIIRLPLPDNSPALESGKLYHWYFKVSCGTGIDFVDGWVQRNSLSANLQKRLEQATPLERSLLYANNGIWFDALTTAAELRRTDLKSQEWTTLLKAVGLEKLVSEPIVDCCKVGDR